MILKVHAEMLENQDLPRSSPRKDINPRGLKVASYELDDVDVRRCGRSICHMTCGCVCQRGKIFSQLAHTLVLESH